ncbi:MAG: hypothetical protein KKG00_17545, partial [Bacteroidetes bacterium]|nr:hypothetical protein [Bacteroidota bacterium]
YLFRILGKTIVKIENSIFSFPLVKPEDRQKISFIDLHFVNDSTGFITTNLGYLIKLQTNKALWQDFSVKPNVKLNRCFFISDQIGWVVGERGTIMKTTNGGESWIEQTAFPAIDWNSLYFLDEHLGYLVGSNGHLVFTTDGGSTWTRIGTNTRNTLNDITFIDGTGYIVGDAGTILVSSQLALPDCTSPLCIPFSVSKVKAF